jgi:hypothetical protein
VVVGTPGDDALFDGFGFEVLGEGFVGEDREFGVGGEAQGDELLEGELVDVGAVGGGEQGGEAEALFEADGAVLDLEGGVAGATGHEKEDDGHDDVPEVRVLPAGPVVDGDVDGEDEVEQEERDDDEVEGGVEAHVVLEGLRCGHEASFPVM